MILNQKTVNVSLADLKQHPRNPRKGNLASVKASIEANGFFGSVIAQKSTGYVLAGNHRYMAALELGFEKIPVTWVDVDDTQATKILLADNRTSDLATYDFEALALMLKELDESVDIIGTGYESHELTILLRSLDPPEPKGNAVGGNTSGEVDVDKFTFEHQCPRCSFRFNGATNAS